MNTRRRWPHPRRVAVDDDAFAVGHHLTRLLVVPVVVEGGVGSMGGGGKLVLSGELIQRRWVVRGIMAGLCGCAVGSCCLSQVQMIIKAVLLG